MRSLNIPAFIPWLSNVPEIEPSASGGLTVTIAAELAAFGIATHSMIVAKLASIFSYDYPFILRHYVTQCKQDIVMKVPCDL